MDILQAAQQLMPGVAWNLHVNPDGTRRLLQAEDGTPRVTPPTLEALEALIDAVKYRSLRASEYPPMGDQLDAIMKGGQALADMQNKCMAVKAKYPKPI